MRRPAVSAVAGDGVSRRAAELFGRHRLAILRRTDHLFAGLMIFQWLAGVAVALTISPRAWAGETSRVHVHVWAATLLGGVIVSLPTALALARPGRAATRHVIAAAQMLMGALLIHLTGGRIETHFHVFGSLALLAFYRDWRVLVTASAVVTLDHLLRGAFWPRSVYGVLTATPWRWAEHAGWVAFEDAFLIRSCVLGVREMRDIAWRQAELEATREGVERMVRERTAQLEEANHALEGEVAERARVELALRESEARFRSLSACSPVGIFRTDTEGRCTYVNPRAQAIAGHSEDDALGAGWQRFIHEDDRARVLGAWGAASRGGREFEEVYRFRAGGGLARWVHCRAAPMHDARGQYIGHVGTIEDTTEWKRIEAELAHQATHDALTGLSNRVLLQQSLERAVESARAETATFALLVIDLDRFKEINDSFGHHCGDEVLRQLNPRLRDTLRKTDTLARLGGDEFAALLPEADAVEAVLVAERMLEALKRPIVVDGLGLEVGASVGVAIYPGHGHDAATLMQHADVAMYAAKRARVGYAVYAPDQSDSSPRRLALISELRQAIDGDQLVMHYQPKVDLKTMRVGGAEALARWIHPRDGMIMPGQFIPLAEHTGLIRPLGLWALRTVLRQCRLWRQAGLNLNVAANLAPENLRDEELVDSVIEFLEGSDSLPSWLTLEVTEGAMMADPRRARDVLGRLHEMGVRVSIDDFGTGYSSLAYLKTLPVDEVKIDRGFVRDMLGSEKDACIVRSVIELGHNLGLRVVAEGVEDRASLELLARWGCDLAQGYYFSGPLLPAQFLDWEAGHRESAASGVLSRTAGSA